MNRSLPSNVKNKNKPIRLASRKKRWARYHKQWFLKNPPNPNGKYTCHYCLKDFRNITLDHKNGRGGRLLTEDRNIVPACKPCNSDKGDIKYLQYLKKIGRA